MNCVNCGHSMKAHDGDKCTGSPDCVCKEWQRVKFSVDETSTFRAELVASKLATLRAELAAYKAEAMAAREYIKYLESNLMWGVRSEDEFEQNEQMYLTALVMDGE